MVLGIAQSAGGRGQKDPSINFAAAKMTAIDVSVQDCDKQLKV